MQLHWKLCLVFVFLFLMSFTPLYAAEKLETSTHVAWVEKCLRDFEFIKPGITRAEVEKRLSLDGGLQSFSSVRFVHPECAYFKINVEFEVKKDLNDQGRIMKGADNKVIKVSKPYIELPYSD